MERAPGGTTVGVDDPYEHADRCDHVTDDGRCRWARERGERDPAFADARAAEDFACPVAEEEWDWRECPHFRCRATDRECVRCGLTERRDAIGDGRPLLEEHHLSYPDRGTDHEITVYLCRWCHATVHQSWGRIDDDVNPDPEAVAAREERRSAEREELSFDTAAERFGDEDR